MSYDLESVNPYYDPKKFGLTLFCFDQPDMSYEFNMLCFWVTSDGRLFMAQDSGCSCPVPFEDFASDSLQEMLDKMEHLPRLDMAFDRYRTWREGWAHEDADGKIVAWTTEWLRVEEKIEHAMREGKRAASTAR